MVSEHLESAKPDSSLVIQSMGKGHRLYSRALLLTVVLTACSLLVLAPAGASPRTGSGGKQAALAAPANNTNINLRGVSCVSSADCTAVGYSNGGTLNQAQSGGTPDQTLIVHWDGSAWMPVTSPNASAGSNEFYGVSCLTSSECTAVGSYSNGTVPQTLVEHWDGTAWTVISSPNVSTTLADLLLGVDCTSPSDCTAVGKDFPSAGSGNSQPLVEHWDGTTWTIASSPTPPAPDDWLDGVACVASSDCTAVGGNLSATLIEHWDGTAWSVVASPNVAVPAPNNWLMSVACTSASDCTAVGQASIVHWDGTAWSLASTLATGTELNGVACISTTDCTAVGSANDQLLIENWNGSSWAAVTSPTVPGAIDNVLYGASCNSASDCTAIGSLVSYPGGVGVYQAPIDHWNGSGWSIADVIGVPGAPSTVVATGGAGRAVIAFKPPVLRGGNPIMSYQVTATDTTTPAHGGQTASGSTSPVSVAGLTTGDSYTFTVTAANAFGTGPSSAPSNQITVKNVPSAPTLQSAGAGDGEVLLSWNAPTSIGGSPVMGYDIFVGTTSNGESSAPLSGSPVDGSPVLVTGLTDGVTYYFKVTALNALGGSGLSNEVSAVPSHIAFRLKPGAAATNISQGADGSLWVIGTNPVPGGYGIYEWTGSSWAREPGGAVAIAVAPDGTPLVINSAHQIFVWTGSGWGRLPGAARDIAVGADGSLWVIGTNPVPGGYGIYEWNGSGWGRVAGGAVDIAVAPDGTPLVVNSAHQIFVWTGSGWGRLPGAARDIAVGADGSLWVIGTNPVPGGYGIYEWNGSGWGRVAGGAVDITVGPVGRPWVINSNHQIFAG